MEACGNEIGYKEVGFYNQPKADITGLNFKLVTTEEADMDVDVEFENPNELSLELVDIDFELEDLAPEDDNKKIVITKKVEYSYSFNPHSSELITVPLSFAYQATPSSSVERQVVPYAMRAHFNFREAINGAFGVSSQRVKRFLTIVDDGLGIGRTLGFNRPTGFVNGLHYSSISPVEANIYLIFRVKNQNALPVQLVYSNIIMEAEKKQIFKRRVENNVSVRANSEDRVKIPLPILMKDIMAAHPELGPGKLLPFTLKMEFWFKENFYGLYKVYAEKSGEVPILAEPKTSIQKVVFEYDESNQPCAVMNLKIENNNTFEIKTVNTEYEITTVEGSNLLAKASSSAKVIIPANGHQIIPFKVDAEDPSFGSALWELFTASEDAHRYKATTHMEAETPAFGNLIIP